MIKCNLKDFMELRDINFSQLSKETKISRQALTALANNESSGIQFSTLDTLLRFFNAPIEKFFTQSAMDFGIYIHIPDEEKFDYIELCILYNRDEIVIPYKIDFFTNKSGNLEIIEYSDCTDKLTMKNNFYISEPFIMLMLNEISQDRFNEFGFFLIKKLLPVLKDLYSFNNVLRVNFDLQYSFRTAYIDIDNYQNAIVPEISEFNPNDATIDLIDTH